jgi:hypothetical protein
VRQDLVGVPLAGRRDVNLVAGFGHGGGSFQQRPEGVLERGGVHGPSSLLQLVGCQTKYSNR